LIFLGLGALAFVFVGGWLTIDAQESIEEPAPVMAPASTPESNPAGGQ